MSGKCSRVTYLGALSAVLFPTFSHFNVTIPPPVVTDVLVKTRTFSPKILLKLYGAAFIFFYVLGQHARVRE